MIRTVPNKISALLATSLLLSAIQVGAQNKDDSASDLAAAGARELFLDDASVKKEDTRLDRMFNWIAARLSKTPSSASDDLPPPDDSGPNDVPASERIESPPNYEGGSILKSPAEIRELMRPRFYQAKADRVRLMQLVRRLMRVYVSSAVDSCKQRIAAGDEIGARSACGIAEQKMTECRNAVAPYFDQQADRLTATFRSLYGDDGDFRRSKLESDCQVMLMGLDDPATLLRKAGFRLPDQSCYDHLDRLKEFVETGAMKVRNALGPDDATPEAYRKFITRMCRPDFERKAWDIISAGVRRDEEVARRNAQLLAMLPRKQGEATSVIDQSITQTNADLADPAARAAREQQERERRQLELAAIDRANAEYKQRMIDSAVTQYQEIQAQAAERQAAEQRMLEQQREAAQQRQAAAEQQRQQQQEQQQRQAALQQEEQSRYYSPVTSCISVRNVPQSNGAVSYRAYNICNQTVELSWPGGMWSVGAGGYLTLGADSTIYGACQKNDGYDRSRGMCKR